MPRTKTFTIESVLDKVIEVFRRHGYHNTSLLTIADRLGLSRSSIYATFGDKLGLFEQTLRHYGTAFRAPGLDELRDAAAPRAALLRVFELTTDGAAGGHNQCLLINAVIELGDNSPTIAGILQTALGDLETCFREAIERARTADEIAAGVDSVHTARALLGLYLGLCVLVRSGGDSKPMQRAVVLQVQSLLPHVPPGDQLIDIDFDTDCGDHVPYVGDGPYYVVPYDPSDHTRTGNYFVETTAPADTSCARCKKPLPKGSLCSAIYQAANRKGRLLGYRCRGECTDGKKIDQLPPEVDAALKGRPPPGP